MRPGTFLALHAASPEAADENPMQIIEIERPEIRLEEGTEIPRNNRPTLLGIEAPARDLEGGIRKQSLSASFQERGMRDVALTTGYFAIVLTAMIGWVWMLISSVGWLIGV